MPPSSTDRTAWLLARQTGIGGSDAAAVLGVHPARTALDVYHEKIADPPIDKPATPPMRRGAALEDIVADLYHDQTGRTLRRVKQKRSRRHSWMIANIDRRITPNAQDRTQGVLEIKCPGLERFAQFKMHGIPYEYLVQMQHYLAVTDWLWGSFAIFSAERWELVTFDVERDRDFIAELCIREEAFWRDHVVPRIPPTIERSDETQDLPALPTVSGEVVAIESEEWAQAVADMQTARDLEATAIELKAICRERIIDMVGGYGIYQGSGVRVHYHRRPGRTYLDRKALERAKPRDALRVAARLLDRGLTTEAIEYALDPDETSVSFDSYERIGKPFNELRMYRMKDYASEEPIVIGTRPQLTPGTTE